MARIDEILDQVSDHELRTKIAVEVDALRRQMEYGLVFERHVPEMTRMYGHPITQGALVQEVDGFKGASYRVAGMRGEKVDLVDVRTGKPEERLLKDLVQVKKIGEPLFPGLKLIDRVERAATKSYHSVINAENYHALQLLTFTNEAQVDVIYIDPPYNTGARDWRYNNDFVDANDRYRHSKWLAFMERRLLVARRLLRPEGVLIITIDENEHARLVLLLEKVFPAAEITSVVVVHNPRGIQGDNFSFTHEIAVFVVPSGTKPIASRPLTDEERSANTATLRKWGNVSTRDTARNCFYPIYVESSRVIGFGEVAPDDYHPASANVLRLDGSIEVWPIDNKGVERKWRYARGTVDSIRNKLEVKVGRGGVLDVHLAQDEGKFKTVWQAPKFDASSHGTQMVRRLTGVDFPFPKSLYSVYEALFAACANNPNALVLDFFGGSGSTLHATCLLNTHDGGSRRCILVTNNEVDEDSAKVLNKRGLRRGDADFEDHGICRQVTMPRVRAAITGIGPEGPLESGLSYLEGDRRKWADGFDENVAFFDLALLERDDVELGNDNDKLAPLLWLKAGARGDFKVAQGEAWTGPKGASYAVLHDPQKWSSFVRYVSERGDLTHVFVNTDSEATFALINSELPPSVKAVQLHHEYLEHFARGAEEDR